MATYHSIRINYFNTFIVTNNSETSNGQQTWHVEESRIKGGYNNTTVDFGVRAYVVDENYNERLIENGLIHSGIYNSKTSINNTNQYSAGESITKQLDKANGSIQKLYSEETNMLVLQEDKVTSVLIDKDAIFSASGGSSLTSSKSVLGEAIPYTGRYGISKNPESFAVFGRQKYFTDRTRGLVLRLSQDGITEISGYGMRNYFRDKLKYVNKVYGMFDTTSKSYILNMHINSFEFNDRISNEGKQAYIADKNKIAMIPTFDRDAEIDIFDIYDIQYVEDEKLVPAKNHPLDENQSYTEFKTIAFDSELNGWTSFMSFNPIFGCSLNSRFYTFQEDTGDLWIHNNEASRCKFYETQYGSSVTFVVNKNPSLIKTFKSINYEGTGDWIMSSSITDKDKAYPIPAYTTADYIDTNTGIPYKVGFNKFENKYFSWIKNDTTSSDNEVIYGEQIGGIKGVYSIVTMTNNSSQFQKLFSVSHEYEASSY